MADVFLSHPDFDAVRDKRMSEMTPAQRDDSLELWLRTNIAWMGDYYQKHIEFLLRRLDEARADAGDAARWRTAIKSDRVKFCSQFTGEQFDAARATVVIDSERGA